MRWTKEEELACLEMVREGFTFREIAEAMGREKKSVYRYVYIKRQKAPQIWRKKRAGGVKIQQLCETCFFATGATKNGWKCPWADRLVPVEGWTATPSRRRVQNGKDFYYQESFAIRACPHYEEG